MFEEMAVGVKMALTGDPNAQLKTFTRSVKVAYETTELFSKKLILVNEQFIKVSEILTKLNPLLKDFNGSLVLSGSGARSLNTSFTGLNRRLDGLSERMTNITRKASTLAEGLEGVAAATGTASLAASAGFGAAGFAAGRRGGGHGRGGVHVRGVEFGGLGFTGAAIGAGAGLMLLHGGYEATKTYQQVMAQILLQNIPGTNSSQINQFVDGQNIPGVSKLDLLQKFQDALVITKNVQAAEGIAPYLSQIGYANKAIFGGTKQALSDTQFYAMIKSAELLTGSMDANVLKPVINELVKINSATSGQVQPTQILQLLTKSKGMLKGADPRLLYQLEPLIQEMGAAGGGGMGGGAAVGTGVRTFYSHLVAGRLTTAAALQLEKMHLIKPGFAQYNKIGMIKRILPGGLIDQKLLNFNFIDWYNKYFLGELKKEGITDPNKIKQINSVIFTNTDLALTNLLAQQQGKIATTAALNAHAAGTQQLLKQVPNQTAQEQSLSASYYNFKKALGDLTSPAMVSAVGAFATALDYLTKVIKGIDAVTSFAEKVVKALPTPVSASETVINAVKGHVNANAAPSTIVLQLNKRELGRAITENLNESMYHTQIQQSNTFMSGMTPISPNTGSPIR